MKRLYIPLMALTLCSCHTHKWSASQSGNILIGIWEQQGITLEFKANGRYCYLYTDGDYSKEQSDKFEYLSNMDSVVLYNYYPDAYTEESKHEYWSISKLNSDSLVVKPRQTQVIWDGDTLYADKEPIEVFVRKK
ncbi:hypothetical protein [uncultured Duncaniella sp.]|uniref:hypothetical protein n=1 Tax=uncultured Duncaniella sp. TaxID=2768039 RepID=UPI00262E8836|nr:hypothetical protein [uncultured Duncaniella sp.]